MNPGFGSTYKFKLVRPSLSSIPIPLGSFGRNSRWQVQFGSEIHQGHLHQQPGEYDRRYSFSANERDESSWFLAHFDHCVFLFAYVLCIAAFVTKSVELPQGVVQFDIWDTAGQERYFPCPCLISRRYHSLASMYYRGAKTALVVYDITSRVLVSLGGRCLGHFQQSQAVGR